MHRYGRQQMHVVKMEVYEVGAKSRETNRLATAVIGKHKTPWEAEQMIEQINREEFPGQPRIESLKRSLSDFYGKPGILAFVYTKQAA
jgi:Txe/YoeB family toxin of Txe-Axe toxin-antitoxin module